MQQQAAASEPKETAQFLAQNEFSLDFLYRPLTRSVIRKICAADLIEPSKEAPEKDKKRRKRTISSVDQPDPKQSASRSLHTVTETRKFRNSSATGNRQKKLRTWIPVETLPLLLNSVMESIAPEERAIYDGNKIQDFILKTVSEFGFGISSVVSSQLFKTCQQYLLSHIVGNPAFHSSFRVDFRSPISIKSCKHFLVNTSSTKESTSWNSNNETYNSNEDSEEQLAVNARELDVLNLHLGPRRLTRTLYQVLRSIDNEADKEIQATSRKNLSCELSAVTQQNDEDENQDLISLFEKNTGSTLSFLRQKKEYQHVSHCVVRFLPILYYFFQQGFKEQSHHSMSNSFASIQMKTCLLEVLRKFANRDVSVVDKSLMHFDNLPNGEKGACDFQSSSKSTTFHCEILNPSSLTCPYEMFRKDRIQRNEEILRRITSKKLPQKLLWEETQECDELPVCSEKEEPCVHFIMEEMKQLRELLQNFGIFCDRSLWEVLTLFVQLLLKEQDQNASHSPSFYSTRREFRRMERVLESCAENEQVHEAVRRYLRILQSTEYRERRNLFTLFRGPWNNEDKNAVFFKAWEKYGNGRDANKLIALEMGPEVHPNQVAYMKSLYPGWLVYKQMLSSSSSLSNGQEVHNSTDNQAICAFCLGSNSLEDPQKDFEEPVRDEDLNLGTLIGPLRFPAMNSNISTSFSSFSSNSGYFVHHLCALWAPEVFEAYDGTLLNIAQAIQRARQIFCCYCRRKGASLGCKECKRCYHAPKCALLAGCYLDTTTFQLLCPLHARVEAAVVKNWIQNSQSCL